MQTPMTYSLVKETDTGDHDYVDQDGCWWDSPADWLWIGILGACGCGSREYISALAVEVLTYFATDFDKRTGRIYDDANPSKEILAHWMDSKDLIEHGTSINGSWLNETGKQVYAALRLLQEQTSDRPDAC